ALHGHFNGAPERGTEILRIGNRAFAVKAHTSRHHGVVDVGILKSGSNAGVGVERAALMSERHALDMHDLLVISAIIVHRHQEWDAMMCRRPQSARSTHEVTVFLDTDREPAILPVGP